jgi:protein tyrosine/serine phosphatase
MAPWRPSAPRPMPHDLSTRFGRLKAWLDMHLVDHGFVRTVYNNFHALGAGMFRLSQPSPVQLERYRDRFGIKTVVNLRGSHGYGSYAMEEEACRTLGLALVDHKLYSRRAPTVEELDATQALFESIAYPALMHCKSGADRAGLGSVLYKHFRLGVPMAEAARELDWRYGHFRIGKTAILDYFFQRYLEDNAKAPIAFMDWVHTRYDRKALTEDFKRLRKENGLGDWILDKVLRRE